MQYMILLHSDHEAANDPEPGTPEFEEMMGGWHAFTQSLIDAGQLVGGEALMPPETASVVHKLEDGSASITDGPFAETKEQLGGYYVVNVDNLDEAIEIAKRVPIPVGSFEIRPIMEIPEG